MFEHDRKLVKSEIFNVNDAYKRLVILGNQTTGISHRILEESWDLREVGAERTVKPSLDAIKNNLGCDINVMDTLEGSIFSRETN